MSDPGKSGRDLTPDEARRLRDQVIFGSSGGRGNPPPPGDPGCWLVLLRIMSLIAVAVVLLT